MTKCLSLPQQLALTNFQLLNKLAQVWSVCGKLGGTQINENSSFLQLTIRQRSVCAGCHRGRHNRNHGVSSEFRWSSHFLSIIALLSAFQDIYAAALAAHSLDCLWPHIRALNQKKLCARYKL